MAQYQVIVPLARRHPVNGMESFTHGDLIEIEDADEAKRMISSGMIAPVSGPDHIETADAPLENVEKAVKRQKKVSES